MRSFIRRYLEPADRLGEVLFGLVMALGITGAVRLGRGEADNRTLLTDILGCNVAWGVVDGVMYVLGAFFERARKARLMRDVLKAPSEAAALEQIGKELDGPLIELTTPGERAQLYRWVLAVLRRDVPVVPTVRRDDVLGGIAVALLIVVATFPIVLPYLFVPDPNLAVRISNVIAVTLLFLVGAWWGRVVGGRWMRIAASLTMVGMTLVLLTIALGG